MPIRCNNFFIKFKIATYILYKNIPKKWIVLLQLVITWLINASAFIKNTLHQYIRNYCYFWNNMDEVKYFIPFCYWKGNNCAGFVIKIHSHIFSNNSPTHVTHSHSFILNKFRFNLGLSFLSNYLFYNSSSSLIIFLNRLTHS